MKVILKIREDRLEEARNVMFAIRVVSDLLCNMGRDQDLNMVKPENLQCLMTILADRLEESLLIEV